MKRALVLTVFLLSACEGVNLSRPTGWERMIDQQRPGPYGESEVFADRRAMRVPPSGTVSVERTLGPDILVTGEQNGEEAQQVPLPITEALLVRGRGRFDIYCAACHGLLGDGMSPVAAKMTLMMPPSLLSGRVRAFTPGRLYKVVSLGYGMMPSYALQLSLEDRWAVVAYLRVLQTSQSVPIVDLPEPYRSEALQALH